MLKEIITQVEESRVGRAVAGLVSGSYRFQVVQCGNYRIWFCRCVISESNVERFTPMETRPLRLKWLAN
jgi:hypothetical protein